MNWIETALARQAELLRLLLSGKAAEKKSAENDSLQSGGASREEQAAERSAPDRRGSETAPAYLAAETAREGADSAAGFRTGAEPPEMEPQTVRSRSAAAFSGLSGARSGLRAATPDEAQSEGRWESGAVFAAEAETAETLSRAVERDARRYDGAISLC